MIAKLNIKLIIENADSIWRSVRWKDGIKCECCSEEYYQLGDGRYKCKKCGKIFSDTTGTLLHHSKLPKWKWLVAIWKMSNGKGVSNIELSKLIGVNVKTAWLIQQKVRALMKEDDIKLEGDICIDELHIGGWSNMHFGKKWRYMRENHFISQDSNKYNRNDILAASSKKKEIVIGMTAAAGTKLIHVPNPCSQDIIKQVLLQNTTNVDMLISDESNLYKYLGIRVEQSNHSKGYFTSDGGYSSNSVENRFSWATRKIEGIYTHTTPRYLQLYLNQIAFSASHKDDKVDDKFYRLIELCGQKYISTKDIVNINPFDNFNYIDVYKAETKEALEILELNPLISSIETKHKLKFTR